MANGNGLSLETVHQELERLGSIIRGLSTQIASVRVRVSDLERWDASLGAPGTRRAQLKLMAKNPIGKGPGKGPGKGSGKGPGKGKGKMAKGHTTRSGSKSRH